MIPPPHPADDGILAIGTRLFDDGKALLQAEIALYRAQLGDRAAAGKQAAVLLVAALLVLQSTLTALLVGVIWSVGAWLGSGWATLLVVVAGLAVVGLLVRLGVGHLRRATASQEPIT